MNYHKFVDGKLASVPPIGFVAGDLCDYSLKPHQTDLVRWAARRGRAAIFADTGLGKSRMQVAWSDLVCDHTGGDVLILAPLAVAAQTVEEASMIGVRVTHCHDGSDVRPGINITNYDRLHRFDCSEFAGVVLDESSCIKHHAAKTLQTLLDVFAATRYKLCATATPAPNDWTELGTHAEFLGIRSRAEMLAEFFVHDGGDTQTWRLKGHAKREFWRWVSSWGALVRSPADLGHDASEYSLPALEVTQHTIEMPNPPSFGLFHSEAQTLMERKKARRESVADRVAACEKRVKDEWYKLAVNQAVGDCHELETGIRGSEEEEVSGRPGVSSEAQRAIREEQGGAQGVYGGVLQEQSGQVSSSDSGAAGRVQREASREVCGEQGAPRGDSSRRKGMAAGESTQAEIAKDQEVRNHARTVHGNAGRAGREVRDLRTHGHGGSEFLPAGGSLPQHEQGARALVHELQSGAREIYGQPASLAGRSGVSLEPWLIWCDLNAEQDALRVAFGDLAFSVQGSDDPDHKEDVIRRWMRGERPVMISKPSIMGWGLNFQFCARMAFVGVTDSFEAYYQAVRRCWRFGQKRPVHVHVFSAETEGAVVQNLRRKEQDARLMAEQLSAETIDAVRSEVIGTSRDTNTYAAQRSIKLPAFIQRGSCTA